MGLLVSGYCFSNNKHGFMTEKLCILHLQHILGFDIFEYFEYVYMDFEYFYICLAMCGVLGWLR